MSAHDPVQRTGDPNWCIERYKSPAKCKANDCPCASDILASPRKCGICGANVHYGWMNQLCVHHVHHVEELFS